MLVDFVDGDIDRSLIFGQLRMELVEARICQGTRIFNRRVGNDSQINICTRMFCCVDDFASTAHAGFFDNIVQGLDQLEAKKRLTTYNSVVDKPLVDHFYTQSVKTVKMHHCSKRISAASDSSSITSMKAL